VCEDQGQALGEPFALPDRGHLLVIGLFEAVHDFPGFPTRDVARLTRPKHTIEQTRATQNSDMAGVYRRQRSPVNLHFLCKQNPSTLAIGAGGRKYSSRTSIDSPR
jgi:hypothetical protein